ncbi:MAG: DUF302 domain-containing protein [Candidatus Nanohaloarchaea archaeon]
MSYTTERRFSAPVKDVEEATEEALKDEGFGVLCDIQIDEKFREKLDEEFREYRILGACNPPLAHTALEEEIGIGALLPCNVIVYRDGDETVVEAVDPEEMLSVVDNPELDEIAEEVGEKLDTVLRSIKPGT